MTLASVHPTRPARPAPAALIAAVRERAVAARVAEAAAFVAVGDWADAHTSGEVVGDPVGAYGEWMDEQDAEHLAGDHFLELGGPGAPVVAEFCVSEIAAARRTSFETARRLVGDAVELRHRLPQVHARVAAGEVDVYRARRIAQQTRALTPEGAEFVDRHIAHVAHKATSGDIDRLVAEAVARFDPEVVEVDRLDADADRYVRLDFTGAAYADPLTGTTRGVVQLDGSLDLADALDLEAALSHVAGQLADLGSADGLDVRRSIALGELARRSDGIAHLDLTTGTGVGAGAGAGAGGTDRALGDASDEERAERIKRAAARSKRDVVIYLHLNQSAVTGSLAGCDGLAGCHGSTGGGLDGCDGLALGPGIDPLTGATGIDLAHLDTPGAARGPVTADQVRSWCGSPDTRVIIKPIVDLNQADSVAGYVAPERIADHVRTRWPRCVFPHCTRSSRRCDLDHRDPFNHDGNPDGEGGRGGGTSTDNLYPLCRRHHRMKTHREMRTRRRWTYRPTRPDLGEPPGALIWTSPTGQQYLVDAHGTEPWPHDHPPGPDGGPPLARPRPTAD